VVNVGFIGLGSQGAPMARRIIDAGYPVVLWARRRDSLAPFAETAAKTASSIAELGACTEHVGICVRDDAGVSEVCDQLIPAMRPGGRIAIHSTVHPKLCVTLSSQARARDLKLIDAPVSGGGPGAAAGALTVMVGGDEEAVAAARPIFATFAGLIVRLGGVGAGQTAKLVNNALMAAHVAMAHHALAAGAALGLDRAALADIVKVSSGRSYGFEVYARLPAPSAFAHGAKLLAKDLRLLGEVLGEDASFAAFRGVAQPFLDSVMKG
jgi:3-hydroxyisobutyrate dehydrogenase-like beta-hydroxyacid dehydrogenase